MLQVLIFNKIRYSVSFIFFSLLFNSGLLAHGYVKVPFSRAYACKLGENSNCGAIQYEPQSLEAPSGNFVSGKLDKKLGSVGKTMAVALNEQSLSRWTKSIISSGQHDFTWYFTAPHVSKSFEFYITKQYWHNNRPLEKSDFVKIKCIPRGWSPGQKPPQSLTFTCNLPKRTGYQIMLAEWDVADTTNSFYNLIDLNFKGSSQVVDLYPTQIGKVTAHTLLPGAIVEFMPFETAHPEGMQTIKVLTIQNKEQGSKYVWPYLFAHKFNTQYAKTFNNEIKIGEKGMSDDIKNITISPTYEGENIIYAKQGSKYTDAEIIVKNNSVPPKYTILITGIEKNYTFKDGKAIVLFQATSQSNDKVGYLTASVENNRGEEFGITEATLSANETKNIELKLPTDESSKLTAGNYKLIITTSFDNIELKQKTYEITLRSGEPPVCPAYNPHHGAYKGGDCVTNYGKHYYCKQFPYSGWCGQAPLYYEPGKGLDWQQAWSTTRT